MIYDRTQNDIETARELIETKVKAFAALTADEILSLERGTLTINTLNRIEEKQSELNDLINAEGYYNTNIINRLWTHTDVFDEVNFSRIVNNCEILKKAFFEYTDTPATPNAVYHFENINSIEKILVDLEKMIDDVKLRYRQCGTFQCGEENNL